MRVLLASKFLHHVGGVETYLRWQATALSDAGHEVALVGMTPPDGEPVMDFPKRARRYLTPYRSFEAGADDRLRSAAASVYSAAVATVFDRALREFQPEVVHFHCTCYQLTPSIFRQTSKAGIPAFMTAHEYKLACANQTLYDEKRSEICTDCVGQSSFGRSLAIIRRSCIKGSRGPSMLGAVEAPIADRYWDRLDGTVLAPSQFMADLLTSDRPRRTVQRLELPWPAIAASDGGRARDSVLFLGRLAPEKGILIGLDAWQRVAEELPEVRLRIAGSGSEEQAARDYVAARRIERVDFLGRIEPGRVEAELARAIVTIHPAQWFENSPFSVRESLCAGVPVIVSDLGGMPELVSAATGWVVPAADPAGWARTIRTAAAEDRAGRDALLTAVRSRWIGPDEHMAALIAAYKTALAR